MDRDHTLETDTNIRTEARVQEIDFEKEASHPVREKNMRRYSKPK